MPTISECRQDLLEIDFRARYDVAEGTDHCDTHNRDASVLSFCRLDTDAKW
jgi:hypothetical protein